MARQLHSTWLVHRSRDWQKSVRCIILIKSLMIVALMATTSPAHAAEKKYIPLKSSSFKIEQASTGNGLPCVPPQIKRMDKSSDATKPASRIQRNAAPPPTLSYAMALSIALGLRSATGPVKKSAMAVDGDGTPQSRTYAAQANNKQCAERVSMK